ncbi:hypothetical protein ISS30_10595 [bacterium]|nr:hypothetical protein [bacterium]
MAVLSLYERLLSMTMKYYLPLLFYCIIISITFTALSAQELQIDSEVSDSLRLAPDSMMIQIPAPDSIIIDSMTVRDTLSAEPDSVEKKAHSPSGAMWRSLILPGWGQYYNRKYVKSAVTAGSELSLIYAIYYQDFEYNKAKRSDDDYRAKFYRNDRNKLIWWLTGFLLYSMADAYVDAHLINFNVSEDLWTGITPGGLTIIIKLP